MSKRVIDGYKMWDATSLAATNSTSATNIQYLDKASIFIEWTGSSPVGTLTVQARNKSNGTWYDLDFGAAITVSGNTGDHQIVLNEIPFIDIRLTYTRTSGTGSITATLVSKATGV